MGLEQLVTKPPRIVGPGAGLFRNDHFQVAYATNDIDRARTIFSERFGIREFRRLEGPLAEGGQFHIELGWAGGVMYELAWAKGPGGEVFYERLPADRFAIQHHHLGYLVPTEAAWAAVQGEIERLGYRVALKTNAPGFMQACIIEVPELGHYLEYIFPEPDGVAFFDAVPSN